MKFYGTKVEIILQKAEPGGWSKLSLPQAPPKIAETPEIKPDVDSSSDDDLDDIEVMKPQANLKDV